MSQPRSQKRVQTISGIVLLLVVLMLMAVYFLWLDAKQNDKVGDIVDIILPTNKTETATDNTNVAMAATLNPYQNVDDGYRIEYEAGWALSSTHSGEGENAISTTTLTQGEKTVSISTMPPSLEGTVTNSISVSEESDTTLGGREATKMQGSDLKDGSDATMYVMNYDDQLYVLRGNCAEVNEIAQTFELAE